jgi:hypothetical protein
MSTLNGLPQNPDVSSGGTAEPNELALRVSSGKDFCARSGRRGTTGTSGLFHTLKRNIFSTKK